MIRIFLFALVVLFSRCTSNPETSRLRIAAAANMKFAIDSLASHFEESHEIPIETIVASSGKLTAQIMAGAPFDIFLSADSKYPDTLLMKGLGHAPAHRYALGRLILWCDSLTNEDLTATLKANNQRIAIANPKTAPYGLAAVQALQSLNLYEDIEDRIVYGESISQVNQFFVSGAAKYAFTSLSSINPQNEDWILVDTLIYEPIIQSMLILTESDESQAFISFIQSRQGHSILDHFGYETR